MSNKWNRVMQIDEAIEFMKQKLASVGSSYVVDQKDFDFASGVGIVVTENDCKKLVEDAFEEHKEEIKKLQYDFQFSKLIHSIKEKQKWADPKLIL